jgi:hypothetical protein
MHIFKALVFCLALIVAPAALAAGSAAGSSDKHFGAAFTDAKKVALADVLADVDKFAESSIKIEGTIKDVCQQKGCWLVVTDGKREMRVSFKDYGFFVPKDVKDRKVVLEGLVSKKTITEGAAQHYASESTDSVDPSTIQGPQQIVAMVATGVEID